MEVWSNSAFLKYGETSKLIKLIGVYKFPKWSNNNNNNTGERHRVASYLVNTSEKIIKSSWAVWPYLTRRWSSSTVNRSPLRYLWTIPSKKGGSVSDSCGATCVSVQTRQQDDSAHDAEYALPMLACPDPANGSAYQARSHKSSYRSAAHLHLIWPQKFQPLHTRQKVQAWFIREATCWAVNSGLKMLIHWFWF